MSNFKAINEDGTFEPITPIDTEVIMKLSEIKTVKHEDIDVEPNYKEILLKVSWFLKGMDSDNEYLAELIEEIEDCL